MLNELLILTKIKAGDIKAFEELFRCYYSPCVGMRQALPDGWRWLRKLLRNCFMCFGRIGNSYRFSSL